MHIDTLIEKYNSYEKKNIKLIKNKNIKKLELMKEYGVYVITDCNKNIIYIGKGGTIKQNGEFKMQNISKRLKNIRNKQDANDYFIDVMNDYNFNSLNIYCIKTFPEKLPAFIEADLMQKFYDEHKKLPILNKSF